MVPGRLPGLLQAGDLGPNGSRTVAPNAEALCSTSRDPRRQVVPDNRGFPVLLTDDRLVAAMRTFVTASNRLEVVTTRPTTDLNLLEHVTEEHRRAGQVLQEALLQRGWRSPSYGAPWTDPHPDDLPLVVAADGVSGTV